jgi:hypothetical protein
MSCIWQCRFCDNEAVYDFGAGHVLCAGCCALKVLARAQIKSSFPVVLISGETATAVESTTLAGLPAGQAVADNSDPVQNLPVPPASETCGARAASLSSSSSRRADWHYDSQGYCDNPGRGY